MTTATQLIERSETETHHAAELALLERIVNSRHFAKSALLSGFLRYICQQQLAGLGGELTEQRIGVAVFGRPAGYDCGSDNIVRNYARQLRHRLDDYYRWEGRQESVVLQVPRGAYRPVFGEAVTDPLLSARPVTSAIGDIPSMPTAKVERETSPTRSTRWMVIALAAIATTVLAAVCVLLAVRPRTASSGISPMHSLWSAVFRPDRDTIIVTADSGFGTLQDVLGHRLSLADYTSLRLGNLPLRGIDPYIATDLASQRYTSMIDLESAVALSHLPEVVPNRLAIRFARDLRMEDLKDSNIILLGSAYTDPWTELFEKNLNFELQGDVTRHTWKIVNRHPMPGEPALYQGERDGASHRTYARIAWVPNIDHSGHVLMLGGLDMAGTQAAVQSLLHGNALTGMWQRSRTCTSPDGSFEVLLGTTSIGSSAGVIRVLAERHTC